MTIDIYKGFNRNFGITKISLFNSVLNFWKFDHVRGAFAFDNAKYLLIPLFMSKFQDSYIKLGMDTGFLLHKVKTVRNYHIVNEPD